MFSIYENTISAGGVDELEYELPDSLLNLKGVVISGTNLIFSLGTESKFKILQANRQGSSQKISPNKRIFDFDHKFKSGEVLRLAIKSNHTSSQRINVALIPK